MPPHLAKIGVVLDMPLIFTSGQEEQMQEPLMPIMEEIVPEAFATRIKRSDV